MLDPSTKTWSDLTNIASGPRPSPRSGHGFASADNKLFVFGGYTNGGESARGVDRKAWGTVLVCRVAGTVLYLQIRESCVELVFCQRECAGVARRLLGLSGQPGEERTRAVWSGRYRGVTHIPDSRFLYSFSFCLYVSMCVYASHITHTCHTLLSSPAGLTICLWYK